MFRITPHLTISWIPQSTNKSGHDNTENTKYVLPPGEMVACGVDVHPNRCIRRRLIKICLGVGAYLKVIVNSGFSGKMLK